LIKNFTHKVCGCKGDWTMAAFRDESVAKIRKQVGKGKRHLRFVRRRGFIGDRRLLHEAIGDQLTCIYVDTGLMRAGESKQVVDMFRGALQHPADP
jgi:GMP synthase (glutamine-hydrolysing)